MEISNIGYGLIVFSVFVLLCLSKKFRYYSGVMFIWKKIKPSKESKMLPTFPLWAIGLYIALFGIASQIYENRVDIIENRISGIYAQVSKDVHIAFNRIAEVQNMQCPTKPELFNPVKVIKTFLPLKDVRYEAGVEQLKQLVEDWARSIEPIKEYRYKMHLKEEPITKLLISRFTTMREVEDVLRKAEDAMRKALSGVKQPKGLEKEPNEENEYIGVLAGVNLSNAHLEGANLWSAHLEGANLSNAYIQLAMLKDAHLEGAILLEANLEGAILNGANLKGAILNGTHLALAYLQNAHLTLAYLRDVHLEKANLEGANLRHVVNLEGANLWIANLKGADLSYANLEGAKNLTSEQLCSAKTLYEAEIDENLLKQVKAKCPKLLEDPDK